MYRTAIIIVLAVTLLGTSGCLVTSRNSSVDAGTSVSNEVFDRITLGETRESWLIATVGAPSSTVVVDEDQNVKLLQYTSTNTRKSSGSVFLIFSGKSSSTVRRTVNFQVTDGVVTDFWTNSEKL